MDYLKIFDKHSGYTEYASSEGFLKPNVSHCIEEDHVHYKPLFDPILPENLEVWEEYKKWICNDEEIARDREIFTRVPVIMFTNNPEEYVAFSFRYENYNHERLITITSSSGTPVTNDCGKTYVSIGEWQAHSIFA